MTSDEGSPGAPQSQNDWSSAFETLEQRNEFLRAAYREHRPAIHELASRVCGADRAAEVAQEVFLRLWKHPERFDPRQGALGPYLLASAHDVAIDFLRREIARYTSGAPDDRASNQSDAAIESELHALESAARVAEALASLDPGERDAILGAFYGRANDRTVAASSGLSVEVIRSRIRRGLLRIEKALRGSGLAMMV
jgi:RNA polymerase sigma-70 factor, ECF subfamily